MLKALSNKLDRGALRVDGDITYNGHRCAAVLHCDSDATACNLFVHSLRTPQLMNMVVINAARGAHLLLLHFTG